MADHILDAGWALLLDQGFEKFSFDRLARFARTGKATIYARFSNKEEFLRALLIRQIEMRQREFMAVAQGQEIVHALPRLAVNAVELFLSPEGRLVDRLIDWLDHEGDIAGTSLRGWAMANAHANAMRLLEEADRRGEIAIGDIPTAARFLIEGVSGHARLTDVRAGPSRREHLEWARAYCAMILRAFPKDGC
ncbi:MAG: TetR/AcrR family transcriptional regulator [Proteobacteria bacterium]|nr:TetR/AcrR family transcriptional regulator [Pseudomonadota bacterium]